ncbi:MAG: hypothetical protein AVDCRST_MAG04-3626, partial [uncultured Acetobacteraceae bacterium]
ADLRRGRVAGEAPLACNGRYRAKSSEHKHAARKKNVLTNM